MGAIMIRSLVTLSLAALAAPAMAATLVGGVENNLPELLPPVADPMAGPVNLVENGSFETGDFSGWTQTGDTSFTFVTDDLAAGGPTDGIYHAAFGPVDGVGGIFQFIDTTPGQSYLLSFDIAYLGGDPNGFFLAWGDPDDPQVLIDGADFPGFDYATASGTVVATTASSFLLFAFYSPPSFWLLDNVSLTAVPEPGTWAMLIAGFGMVGLASRRRRALAAA
jgi:hypothetical protein